MNVSSAAQVASAQCGSCSRPLAPSLLSCPHCHALVHAQQLKNHAAEAEAHATKGDLAAALMAWRSAHELLPTDSRQHQLVAQKISELSSRVDSTGSLRTPAQTHPPGNVPGMDWKGPLVAAGGIALLLWKFKALALIVLTKGKLLLLGLSKMGTLSTMLLSFGLYWQIWGWPFALGFVVSLYIHEMGHIAALSRFGIKASAPAFIPGLGALVRLKQYPANPTEDARIGLAGPIWGLGAAIAAYAVYLATGAAIWGAIATTGAWINLFNLMPIMHLDGSRGLRALSKQQRWLLVAVIAATWAVSHEGLLLLLLALAAWRAFEKTAPPQPDRLAFAQFAALVILLSAFTMLKVPIASLPQ